MITLETATQLRALGHEIFDPHLDLDTMTQGTATGLKGPSADMDAKLLSVITPVMQELDGRTPASGFRYTLNVTNAFQLRPKKWFMRALMEYDETSLWPANVSLAYMPFGDGGVYSGVNSFGWSDALATCAAICHAWAAACSMRTMNNYPPTLRGPGYTAPRG